MTGSDKDAAAVEETLESTASASVDGGDADFWSPHHDGLCPYCRESINAEAVICPRCRSLVLDFVPRPNHDGTCPFCKETIDPAASICSHCQTSLVTETLPTAVARLANNGDDRFEHQRCVNRLYDHCVASGKRSSVECNILAERICSGRQFGGGGEFSTRAAASRSSLPMVNSDCGCCGQTASDLVGMQPTATARAGNTGGGGMTVSTFCNGKLVPCPIVYEPGPDGVAVPVARCDLACPAGSSGLIFNANQVAFLPHQGLTVRL
jgi:hypothetical protein